MMNKNKKQINKNEKQKINTIDYKSMFDKLNSLKDIKYLSKSDLESLKLHLDKQIIVKN
jgi:hypothetical protein